MEGTTLYLLNCEINDELERLSGLELGGDQYKIAVDGVTKLVDRQIEMEKIIVENENKKEARNDENEFKRKQMRDENIDRVVKNLLTAVGICGGFALTVWGTYKSFEFEKEGSITTIMGRGFINKLLPKK